MNRYPGKFNWFIGPKATPLTPALMMWIVEKHPEYDIDGISRVAIHEDESSPGYSEWTPGEPWSLYVRFDYQGKGNVIDIREGEVGPFIERLVALAAQLARDSVAEGPT
jgi:hypothetical protein